MTLEGQQTLLDSGNEIRSAAQGQAQSAGQQAQQTAAAKRAEADAAKAQAESQKKEAERMAAQVRGFPQQGQDRATDEMDASRSKAEQKKKELEDAKAQAERKKKDAEKMVGSAGDFTPQQGQDRFAAEGGAMAERGTTALTEKVEDVKGLLQAKLFKVSVAVLALILLVVLVVAILMLAEMIAVEEFSYILLVIYVMMTLLELLRERVAYLADNSLIYEKLPARQFLCQPRYLVLSWLWIPASLASGDRATVYRILCETFISITVFFASLSTEDFFCGEQGCTAWDNTEEPVNTTDPEACACNWVQNNRNTADEIEIGFAASEEECIALVQSECPGATIANYNYPSNGERDCWCQVGTDMAPDPSAEYQSCLLSTLQPECGVGAGSSFPESFGFPSRFPSGFPSGSGFPGGSGFSTGAGSLRRAMHEPLDAFARRNHVSGHSGASGFSSPGAFSLHGYSFSRGAFSLSGYSAFSGFSESSFSGFGDPLGSGSASAPEAVEPPAEEEVAARTYILAVILLLLVAVSLLWSSYLCFKGTILTEIKPRHDGGWMNRLDQVADVFSLAAEGGVPDISDAGGLAEGAQQQAKDRGMAAAQDQRRQAEERVEAEKQKARERVEAEKQRAESRVAGAQDEARARGEAAAKERVDTEQQRARERVEAERQRTESRVGGAQQEAKARGEAGMQDQRRQAEQRAGAEKQRAESRAAGAQQESRARGEAAQGRVAVSATRFGHGNEGGTGLLHGQHSEEEPLGHAAHEIAEEASKLTGEDFNKPPSPYDWKLMLGPLVGIIGACVAAGLYYYVGRIDQDRRRSAHEDSVDKAADSAKSGAKTAAGVMMVLGWTAAAETALGCYHALVLKSRAQMVRKEMASQKGLDHNAFDAETLKAFHAKVEEIRHTAPPGLLGGLWQGLTLQLPMFTAITILFAGISKVAIAARGAMVNFAELEPFTFVLEAIIVVGIIILFFIITAMILVKYPGLGWFPGSELEQADMGLSGPGLRCTPDGVTPELEQELNETAPPPQTRELPDLIPQTRAAPPAPPPPAPNLLPKPPPSAPWLIVREDKGEMARAVVTYERVPVGVMMVNRVRAPFGPGSPSTDSSIQAPTASVVGLFGPGYPAIYSTAQVPKAIVASPQPSWQGVPFTPGPPSVMSFAGPPSIVSGTVQSIKFSP